MNLAETFAQVGAELGIKGDLSVIILTMTLLLSRLLPVIIFSPVLGGEVIPAEVKMGIGFLLGVVLFPFIADRVQYVPTSPLPFIMLLMKEVFIGLTMAFIVSMVFNAAQIAGTMVDTMAGTNMAQIMVPQIQQQVSLFSSLNIQLMIAVFLTLNGHHVVIEAFADSLRMVPIDQFPAMSSGSWAFFDLVMRSFGTMIRVAFSISAPVFIAAFLTDLALGMINRVAPQVQVFFVSMQMKPMVTVMMMMICIHLIIDRMVSEFGTMFAYLRRALVLLT